MKEVPKLRVGKNPKKVFLKVEQKSGAKKWSKKCSKIAAKTKYYHKKLINLRGFLIFLHNIRFNPRHY
jgi:hypothetical protein